MRRAVSECEKPQAAGSLHSWGSAEKERAPSPIAKQLVFALSFLADMVVRIRQPNSLKIDV